MSKSKSRCCLSVSIMLMVEYSSGLIVYTSPRLNRRKVKCWQRAPRPYVQPEDEKMFNEWPETYEPNPEYPGTCPPGLGRENRPLAELDFKNIREEYDEYAMFEVPFHLRWPSNHPWLAGPYERLERAGRFRTSTQIESAIKEVRSRNRQRDKARGEISDEDGTGVLDDLQTLATLQDDSEIDTDDADTENDPLFDDKSSSLLDAALGLDDDDDDDDDDASSSPANEDDDEIN